MVCHASLSLQPHSPHANKRKGSDTEARVIRQEAKKIPASENKRIPVFRINPLLMLNLPDACQYIR